MERGIHVHDTSFYSPHHFVVLSKGIPLAWMNMWVLPGNGLPIQRGSPRPSLLSRALVGAHGLLNNRRTQTTKGTGEELDRHPSTSLLWLWPPHLERPRSYSVSTSPDPQDALCMWLWHSPWQPLYLKSALSGAKCSRLSTGPTLWRHWAQGCDHMITKTK